MNASLHICMCTMCVLIAWRRQKRVSDHLKVELQQVESHIWILEAHSDFLGEQQVLLFARPIS